VSPWDRRIERKIEAALGEELEREGWSLSSNGFDHYAAISIQLDSGAYGDIEINLTKLARAVADEIKS
jgi:hypothetical protein